MQAHAQRVTANLQICSDSNAIILTKVAIAILFDRIRGGFSEKGYRACLSVCGVVMLGFAAGFAYQAVGLYSAGLW